VQLLAASSAMRRGQPVGTGFIVHESGLVLTAKHVIEAVRRIAAQPGHSDATLQVGLAKTNTENMRANFTVVGGELVEGDPRHDLALVRMQPNPFDGRVKSGFIIAGQPIPLLFSVAAQSESRPRDGDPIAVSGYPLSETVLVTTSGGIASSWAMDVQNVTPPGAPSDYQIPDVKDSLLADVAVNPGNSGGPVYSIRTGDVIGICVAFKVGSGQIGNDPFAYNSGLSVVVPIKYGRELIERCVGRLGA
jgi:S1-C subfamily serine protease